MRFLITLLTNQNYATVENKEVPLVLLVLAWSDRPNYQISRAAHIFDRGIFQSI